MLAMRNKNSKVIKEQSMFEISRMKFFRGGESVTSQKNSHFLNNSLILHKYVIVSHSTHDRFIICLTLTNEHIIFSMSADYMVGGYVCVCEVCEVA